MNQAKNQLTGNDIKDLKGITSLWNSGIFFDG
jgi:hypothetical protein